MTEYQATIDDAWEHLDLGQPEHAATLARGVLTHHPDAIDAYVVLAAASDVRAESIALLKEAVFVGDRAARDPGERRDQEGAYDPEAHVRALNNLARLLWRDPRRGKRPEALRHARRALRLDADDRAGTRLLLMAWEASAGNWAAARRITRRFRDEYRTEVRFWLALHAFRDGAADADALLETALAMNPYVAAALQRLVVPIYLPEESYAFRSPDEAVLYASDAHQGWKETPGALAWLASHEPSS